MLSTVPPHSLEAERGVIASVLIDRESLYQISDLLVAEDFYDPSHVLIYRAVLDLFTRNRPIDLLTVREILDDR